MRSGEADRRGDVRIEVLGPLRLFVDGAPVDVPGPKRRALLARLAMAEGRTVTPEELVDALWPTDPPDSARASLQSHVSRLRRHLGDAAWRLEGDRGGYRLVLEEDALDAAEVRSRLSRARELAADDPSGACDLLREARALWRGAVSADLAEVGWTRAWTVRLDELRREIDDLLASCALDVGRPDEAAAVAREELAADPFRESAVRLLMRALADAGRAHEALAAARGYRDRLIEETGLDPTPELAELERDIAGRAPASRAGRIPAPATGLAGRDSELATLHRLLASERLVTIVGPGGVGKTRLAVEAARRAEDATMLALAPVTDPGAVPHALATSLDLRIVHGDVLGACVTLLAAGPHLLVVDNCEHLVEAVRDVVSALLEGCPRLRVLATGREPLGVPGERPFRLGPLPLPDPERGEDLERVASVVLFCDRAERARPGFAPTPEDLPRVADVVRRLDGLPLAIELAAGRMSSFSLTDLRDRLDRALDLLEAGRGPGEHRHRTLRSTIGWSYDLLPDHEQRLFRHLAVFPDGFDLPTAERVGAGVGVPSDAAAALAHLVDTSMVEADLSSRPRYRMLETLRAFGLDRLEASGEDAEAFERLIRWAVDLCAWINETRTTAREPEADAALRREFQNIRAAWRSARRLDRVDDAATLVIALQDVVTWRELTEAWGWAQELIDADAMGRIPRAASVLGVAAENAWFRGDTDEAERLCRRGLEVAGDDEGRRWCIAGLASVCLGDGRFVEAMEHGVESFELSGRTNQGLMVAALAATYRGDLDEARRLNDRLGEVAISPSLAGCHSYVAGEIANAAGDHAGAEAHYARAIDLARASGATFLAGIAQVGLVRSLEETGRAEEALRTYRDLIGHWERTGRWIQQWTTLRNLARLLHSLGEHQTELFLEAAADQAPDAPAVSGAVWTGTRCEGELDEDAISRIRPEAGSATRSQVLDVARRVIERRLGVDAVGRA